MHKDNQCVDNLPRVNAPTPIEVDPCTEEQELSAELQRLVADLSRARLNRVLTSANAIVSFS